MNSRTLQELVSSPYNFLPVCQYSFDSSLDFLAGVIRRLACVQIRRMSRADREARCTITESDATTSAKR